MKIKFLIYFILSIFGLGSLKSESKPNIIYINADDLGVMDVGFMGNKIYKTPNLDQMAREGMVFTNAYAPAANCAPSRAACMTGQYASRTGVYTVNTSERGPAKERKLIPTKNNLFISEENLTIAGALKGAGYTTAQIGKWHVTHDPTRNGFDVNVAGSQVGHPKSYFSPYINLVISDGPKGEYLTDRLTDESIKFITKNKKNPFFLYLPYYTVHKPLQGRKDLLEKYQNIKGVNAHYAAMIEAMDENIGRILAHLEKLNLRENTLVLFTSDNGAIRSISNQSPHRGGKGTYYEGGIREPLVIRWPAKVKAGSRCELPVFGLDFFPTFIEAARIQLPPEKILDGISLMPVLTQSSSLVDRALFWHYPIYLQAYKKGEDGSRDPLFRTRPGSSMRYKQWKLHEFFEDGCFELYNLTEDPGESKNLVDLEVDTFKSLKKQLLEWRNRLDCPVPKKLNPKYDPSISTVY